MKITFSQPISQLPNGVVVARNGEIDIDDESVKQLVRAAALEFMLANTGVGELVTAVESFLQGREELKSMNPPVIIASPVIDEIERAFKKIQQGRLTNTGAPSNSI